MKSDDGITLVQAEGVKNIFVKDWKVNFFTDDKKKIASIAFLRNLVEFSRGETDPSYQSLTSMLHWRPDSAEKVIGDLDRIFNTECHTERASANQAKTVIDLLDAVAEQCLGAEVGLNLENKVVLAIAIRMRAERYVVAKLEDENFWSGIESNQTQKLIAEFKAKFPEDTATAATLDRVALMTPENIHLNSFMYEPIIDMGEDHLRRLYTDVKELT